MTAASLMAESSSTQASANEVPNLAICIEEMHALSTRALTTPRIWLIRQEAPTRLPHSFLAEGPRASRALSVCLATVFSTLWLPGSDNLAKEPPMPQISAFPSIKALSILLLVPLNSTSLPWWTTLSIIAEASLSSPRIVPHLLNSMLVVNTTLRFS